MSTYTGRFGVLATSVIVTMVPYSCYK